MTQYSPDVNIVLSGPMFDGRIQSLIAQMLDDMKFAVGSQALADWMLNMDRSFRNPTPYYETQVMIQRAGTDWVVHDRKIVYGPWLESGSTKRRFSGYGSLRRAVEEVKQHKVQPICERIAREYAPRMT